MLRSFHARVACVLACALVIGTVNASAARRQEPFSTGTAPAVTAKRPQAPPVRTNAMHVAVNQAWTGTSNGTLVTVGPDTYTFGTDAFATIQAGVDAADVGGTVDVLPGTYLETAPGSFLYNGSGPYQFGVFVPIAKPNLTIRGVDAGGAPITSAAGVATTVNYAATNSFGSSGFFIEGDNTTISGLGIGSQTVDFTNKTIEVIADDFTLSDCVVNDNNMGSVYIDDWRATMTTSYVQSYHVLGCRFEDGNSIDVASGPGIEGPPSGRVISGNSFVMSDIYNSITFNGTTPAIGWFVYPVGGAVITGNSFTNTNAAGTIIKARGDYDNGTFDWASYWNDNTYNRATCEGVAPPADLRAYAYSVYTNTRRIEATVQGEVDYAQDGDIVLLKGGSYVEQVSVAGKIITIQGAGRASTSIQSPAALPATVVAGSHSLKPIVAATGGADLVLRDLTVDGLGLGGANYEFTGVAFWNAGGKVLDCDVVRVRETPFSGNQHGLAIYASNNTGGPYAIEVGGCGVSDFQKNGITLNGAGLTVNVHDCTITGQGQTGLNAQNGIQLYGSSGAITNCTVSGHHYTGAGWVATGMLLWGPSTVAVSYCTLTGNQYSVYAEDASGSMAHTSVTATAAPTGYAPVAVELYNDFTSSKMRAARPAAAAAGRVPPPAQAVGDEPGQDKAGGYELLANEMSFDISAGCFTGPGIAGSEGIDLYSEGAVLNSFMFANEISGWEWGMGTGGAGGVALYANHNAITGNFTAGFYDYGPGVSSDLVPLNWWGNAGGPGVGGANPVIGGSVVSSPWLISGTDLNPGCGFNTAYDNLIAAGPAPSCVTPSHPCVVIPVTITRTSSDQVRGFSVTIQLSPELQLCSGVSSVTEGTYLSSVGATHYEVVANGGGSYTVDCAILGSPCGATAPTGTLFSVGVTNTGGDGTGTITISTTLMRDCDNAHVVSTPGPPLNVNIDNSVPGAATGLTATTLHNGNDADGTAKIQITFTAPVDGATAEVYRAPFGQYPEYDDNGGFAPGTPGYPPPAPWTLTPVTASGQYDEPATRDFWYYVAFRVDPCGNVSAVSNPTTGTLNYHLGDVVDPGNPLAVGNNRVDGADISRLGAHYGITLAPNDAYNYLDVGPTTNYSVTARPTTDNRVGFEDLMMFAINFSLVSVPQDAARPRAAAHDAIAVATPELPAVGENFAVGVHMDGAGNVQGASVRLAWDAAVVEPVGVEAGELLLGQPSASVVLAPEPGVVDFAVLGSGAAISGSGEAARVLFRVKAAGDPSIALSTVVARDGRNQPVKFDRSPASEPSIPATTSLGAAYPNPFDRSASLMLSLARVGAVKVAVYDVAGRRVRTLMDGVQPAGTRIVTWDGRSDAGLRMAAGVYVIRLEAGGFTQSRRLQFVP